MYVDGYYILRVHKTVNYMVTRKRECRFLCKRCYVMETAKLVK
jgi:hypothetical protein